MDKLDSMFEFQNTLQKRLGTWAQIKNPQLQQEFTNQMIIALGEEVFEIARKTAYKNPDYVPFGWKKTQQIDRPMILEECVDLFHFLMNVCLNYGFTAEDFYECYLKKNGINHLRQDHGY